MPLNKQKIFFVTGSRSEFGQFSYFLKRLSKEKKVDLYVGQNNYKNSDERANTFDL